MIYNQQLLKLGGLVEQSWIHRQRKISPQRRGQNGKQRHSHYTLCTRKNRVFETLRHLVKMYYNLYTYTVGVKKKVLH